MKKTIKLIIIICFTHMNINSQSNGEKAGYFSCECVSTILSEVNINTTLMEKLFTDYEILEYSEFKSKHESNGKIIHRNISNNYSKIKTKSYKCRNDMQNKFARNINSPSFKNNFQKKILNCGTIQCLVLLKKMHGNYE